MTDRRHLIYRVLLIIGTLAATAFVWSKLPDRLPVHWDLRGRPDRWGTRFEGALFGPGLLLAMWALSEFLPRLDPRRENFAKMRGAYDLCISALLTLLVVMHLMVLGIGLGYDIPIARIVPAAVGALFVVLGNMLPRARPNWWFGIRTPWTLSSDRVWAKTHRVGGYLMAISGFLLMISAALPGAWSPVILIAVLVPAAIVPIVYSYVAWRRETRA